MSAAPPRTRLRVHAWRRRSAGIANCAARERTWPMARSLDAESRALRAAGDSVATPAPGKDGPSSSSGGVAWLRVATAGGALRRPAATGTRYNIAATMPMTPTAISPVTAAPNRNRLVVPRRVSSPSAAAGGTRSTVWQAGQVMCRPPWSDVNASWPRQRWQRNSMVMVGGLRGWDRFEPSATCPAVWAPNSALRYSTASPGVNPRRHGARSSRVLAERSWRLSHHPCQAASDNSRSRLFASGPGP